MQHQCHEYFDFLLCQKTTGTVRGAATKGAITDLPCKRLVSKEPIGVEDLVVMAVNSMVKVELAKGSDNARAFAKFLTA